MLSEQWRSVLSQIVHAVVAELRAVVATVVEVRPRCWCLYDRPTELQQVPPGISCALVASREIVPFFITPLFFLLHELGRVVPLGPSLVGAVLLPDGLVFIMAT